MKFIPIQELDDEDEAARLAPILGREGIPCAVLEYRSLPSRLREGLGTKFGLLLVPATFEEQAGVLLNGRQSVRAAAFVEVYALQDRFAADVVAGALDSEGIAYRIEEHVNDGFEPAYALQHGYGRVLVPSEEAGRARAIIKAAVGSA